MVEANFGDMSDMIVVSPLDIVFKETMSLLDSIATVSNTIDGVLISVTTSVMGLSKIVVLVSLDPISSS